MKPYQAVYQTDTPVEIRTLGHGERVLNTVPHPILRYRQQISLLAPERDACYKGLIRYDRENQIVTLSFPSVLFGVVTRIQNSHSCRMVTYWKNPVTDFIQEVEITRETQINFLYPAPQDRQDRQNRQEIRIYTKGVEDLVISFDVWLFKRAFFWGKSAL